jgi:predicted transcriptional regulator of viral defense system
MDKILDIARNQGVVRPSDLVAIGIDPGNLRYLYRTRKMLRVGRGLYTLPDYDFTEHHTLVEAVNARSRSVVCLLSALVYHGIGTQLPHQVWLAIPFGAWVAKSSRSPVRLVVLRAKAYEAGTQIHRIEGIDVPIYNVAKTVADCFKFRNKVGLDLAIEALREALRQRRCTREEIRQFARIGRVENVMRPYMEALSV